MSTDPRIKEISEELIRPASIEVVQAVLPQIDQLTREPELWLHVNGLIRRAFHCLRQLTEAQPDAAFSVLVDDLLPRCLRPDEDCDPQKLPRYDIVFGEWLEVLPEERRHEVRGVALSRVLNSLDTIAVRNALRLIGSIGYWDDDVLAWLDRLITSRGDETGDHALAVRTSLFPNFEEASWLLSNLHDRMARGPNLYKIIAVNAIGSSETAEVIWRQWLTPRLGPAAEPARELMFDLALSALRQIVVRSRDFALSEQVWSWLLQLVQAMPDELAHDFVLNSGLAERLNIVEVVPELLRRAGRRSGHHPYLYYRRLRECAQPAHLNAWDSVPLAYFEQVRTHASKPTGMTGRYSTIELDQKEAAWDVLLCRGDSSLLPPFSDVLGREKSGYILHRFLEFAGCLALTTLPPEVSELLAASSGRTEWSEQERLIAQIGAIRAAHGAASQAAFDALLRYRLVGKGVLLSLMDALAEIAMLICRNGDRTPIRELFNAAELAPRDDTRGAAAGAVSVLLELGYLTREEITRAAALAAAPGTDPYARRELLFAFATREPNEVPGSLLEYAASLQDGPEADENRDPRPAAIALLARQPGSRSDADFLTQRLGLVLESDVVTGSQSSFQGVVPHVVGRYFADEPEKFGGAIESILLRGDAAAVSNVLPFVREVGLRSPPQVVNALVDRLRRADASRIAELPLIDVLAIVAPDRLVTDASKEAETWLPQARAHLADTLGRLPAPPEALKVPRFDVLVKLAGDGIYAVRRAAYRALVACDSERTVSLIRSWVQWREAGREGPRRRAAECAGWLTPDAVDFVRVLGWDQEPGVREAYQRSIADSDERVRCRQFEEQVLAVSRSEQVLEAWKFGIALSQVGDDLTLHRLALRASADLPPPVRFWLSRVRQAVERRWRDVTAKWPEPWFARAGHLESFTGTMRAGNHEFQVVGMLWRMQAELPNERSSWGGWAKASWEAHTAWDADYGELIIPDRRVAQVVVTSFQLPVGDVVFSGSGPYPDPIP